MRIDWIPDGG